MWAEDFESENEILYAMNTLENCLKSVIDSKSSIPSGKKTFLFNHYHPFPYLYETDSFVYPGEFTALLEDIDGEGVAKKKIYFIVEKDSVLDNIFYCGLKPNDPWFRTYPQYRAIGGCKTDFSGSVRYNYLFRSLLDPNALANELIKNNGSINGTVTAVAVDDDTLDIEEQKTLSVTFDSIAKVVEVSDGVYVRGKEYLGQTTDEGYKKVQSGHGLQPGDCLRMNGSSSIDIVWINGNRVIAKVPKKMMVNGGYVTVDPQKIYIMATAYDSGFTSPTEKIEEWVQGPTLGWAIDALIERIPWFKEILEIEESAQETYEFIIDKTSYVEEAELTGNLVTKIRLRSRVLVESAQNYSKIYNINGSPDVKIIDGDEVLLYDGEVINVSNNGSYKVGISK